MRRLCAIVLLILLVACDSTPATVNQPTPNARQETATAVASRSISAMRTALPTVTSVGASPTTTGASGQATATANLAPVTITPLPSPTPLFSPTPTATPLPTETPLPTPIPTPAPPTARSGSILFNRSGAIWDFNIMSGQMRQLVEQGTGFRISPDGKFIAFLRDGTAFLTNRDGSNETELLRHVTEPPAWSPDSTSLALVTGTPDQRYPIACSDDNQVMVLTLSTQQSVKVSNGCQPAWHPDNKRIAYITPAIGDTNEGFNTLGLVNREGKNGWTPVSAPVQNGTVPDARRFLYAPFWNNDGTVLYGFGFIGYRTLTDISTLEQINPSSGGTLPIAVTFDVQPDSVRVNRDGSDVAYITAGAKGTTSVSILPTKDNPGTFNYIGQEIEVQTQVSHSLEFASAVTWSPDGLLVALVYCESANFMCTEQDRAEVRLLDPRTGLTTRLFDDVDGNSSIEWGR